MDPKAFHRKLAAILSADVAGYSRLMQDDKAATVTTLESSQTSFLRTHQSATRSGGGLPGRQHLLAEFASAVVAVQCVVAKQKELPENLPHAVPDRRESGRRD